MPPAARMATRAMTIRAIDLAVMVSARQPPRGLVGILYPPARGRYPFCPLKSRLLAEIIAANGLEERHDRWRDWNVGSIWRCTDSLSLSEGIENGERKI